MSRRRKLLTPPTTTSFFFKREVDKVGLISMNMATHIKLEVAECDYKFIWTFFNSNIFKSTNNLSERTDSWLAPNDPSSVSTLRILSIGTCHAIVCIIITWLHCSHGVTAVSNFWLAYQVRTRVMGGRILNCHDTTMNLVPWEWPENNVNMVVLTR